MAEAGLYVRASQGRYTRRRWACIWITQLVYFGLPWLQWDGLPAVRLDIPARRLTLFGNWWGPHDLLLLLACGLLALCALLFAASRCGRAGCGYACPHSVYGALFMWIERRVEGNPQARRRLEQARWSGAWWRRKGAKHAAWLALAGWIGFTLAAYFTPPAQLLAQARAGTLGGWALACMLAYGALAYLNAGVMRERFCRFICPWGRFQGLVAGPATWELGYDAARGEPRARRNRKRLAQDGVRGDCIDCTLCLQVCPAGIDIRDGQAFDCIGCGACADACDQVMDKIGAARGLVGYARDAAAPAGGRGGAGAIAALALVALSLLGLAAYRHAPLQLALAHDRAAPFRVLAGGVVENVYRMHVTNTGRRPGRYAIAVSGLDTLAGAPAALRLEGGASRVLALRLHASVRRGLPRRQPIAVELVDLDRPAQRVRHEAVFFTSEW